MLQTPLHLFLWVTTALTAVLAIWMARVAWRYRPTPGAKTLAWLMLAIAARSGAFWIIFTFDDPHLRLRIAQISHFFVAAMPVLGLIFVLSYTGFSRHFNRNTPLAAWLPLWFIPLLASLLVLVYPWNRLIWQTWVSNPGAYATITFGPLQPWVTAYLWGLLVIAALVISWHALAVRGVHRRTALMVAAAMLIPILPNALWLLNIPPSREYDFTYLGMLASAILMLLAVNRGSLLDLRPIARDLLMEQLGEAILVVDARLRVVDCNRAAMAELGLARAPLGGALPGLLAQWLAPDPAAHMNEEESVAALLEALDRAEKSDGILVLMQPKLRHLHWRLLPLGETESLPAAGWVITWRDVTQERLKLAMLYEQERALSMLAERERYERELAARTKAVLDYAYQVGRTALDAIEAGDPAAGAASLAQLVAVAGAVDPVPGYTLPPAGQDRPTEQAFLDALASFLQNYGRTVGCTVEFVCNEPQIPAMLSSWILVQLVRILQETLEGIQRQLALHSMHVSLAADPHWVVVGLSLVHEPATGMQATTETAVNTDVPVAPQPAAGPDPLTNDIEQISPGAYLPGLVQGSIQQRLAAVDGELTVERLHATQGRVRISLPRLPLLQHMVLRNQQVLIAATRPASLDMWRVLLKGQGMQIVGATADREELLEMVQRTRPQVILVELELVAAHLAGALWRLRRSADQARIIVVLAEGEAETSSGVAIRLGADGCLRRHPDPGQFLAAMAGLLAGAPPLSPALASELLATPALLAAAAPKRELPHLGLTDRQREILSLVVRGFTYREIAAQLYISERTVRYDAEEIRKRMQVPNRAAMIEYTVRHGLA